MDPKDVGLDDNAIMLTARSGRAALKHRLELLGYVLEQEELDKAYEEFLKLADSKKDIRDEDLLQLAGDTTGKGMQSKIKMKRLQVLSGTVIPTAVVVLEIGGTEFTASGTGNGPVDAAVNAIKSLINRKVIIDEFLIQAMTKGSNDVGRVHIQLHQVDTSRVVHGFSAKTDVVLAAVEAFVDGVNKLMSSEV